MNTTRTPWARLTSYIVLGALLISLIACGGSTGAAPSAATPSDATPSDDGRPPTVQTVNFTLNWFPLADHAPNYVALGNGWFEEDGLGVNIIQGSGSGTSIRRVETGQADIGIADVGVLINAIRNGAHLKIIMITIDKGTAAIYAPKGKGINVVTDLVGKTIGAPPEDAGRLIFPALASTNGFNASDVSWVDITPASQWQILAKGQVDAILSSTTQLPFAEKALGGAENVVHLPYSDYGVDLYSQAIFTSDRMIAERSDVLRSFLDSVLRGWKFTFDDPEGALKALQVFAPQIDLEAYRGNLALVLEHDRTPRFEEHGMGWIDEGKLQQTVNIIQQNMPTQGKDITDVSAIYTNEFLTKYPIK